MTRAHRTVAENFRHAALVQGAKNAGISVLDLARAWASIDGKLNEFEIGEQSDDIEAGGGHYAGYICEVEELLKRATGYALSRT